MTCVTDKFKEETEISRTFMAPSKIEGISRFSITRRSRARNEEYSITSYKTHGVDMLHAISREDLMQLESLIRFCLELPSEGNILHVS